MHPVRRSLAAPCLAALLLGAPACRMLPEDHYLQTWSRRAMARWRKVDPIRLRLSLPHAWRGMRHTVSNVSSLGLPAPRGLPRAVGEVTQHAVRDLRGLPRSLGARLESAARSELQGLATGLRRERSPLGEARRLAPALQRFARGLRGAPRALGLERRILPGPTDPEKQTLLHERPREETMGERLLRRLLR